MSPSIHPKTLLNTLPPPWSGETAMHAQTIGKLVVLDDDPTGTQTVHGIPILTDWHVASLEHEFNNDLPCFYILTNSRSLPDQEARHLTKTIARNLTQAAGDQHPFTIVSRSDSTLRGHYPTETDVLQEELGPFHATLLVPFFEAGGRFTVHDTHYVQQGEQLVPAAETPFARDSVFGYQNSDLKAWVEEKTKGRIASKDVDSLSLECIRTEGSEGVLTYLKRLKFGSVCIVNAAESSDLNVVVTACKQASTEGFRFLYRTGAQWVSSWLGLGPRQVQRQDQDQASAGGLIVVGSHVPTTSRQLARLTGQPNLVEIECPVHVLLDEIEGPRKLEHIIHRMNEALGQQQNVVLFTSRELVTRGTDRGDLNIGKHISNALVKIVSKLRLKPRYLIAKGGITSSDVATHALGVQRAMVLGQAAPGIPVWEMGPETLYPGMHYIVFPGNVGNDDTLLNIYQTLNP